LDTLEKWLTDYSLVKKKGVEEMWVEGMGEWFLTDEKFIKWKDDPGPGKLVLHGNRKPFRT